MKKRKCTDIRAQQTVYCLQARDIISDRFWGSWRPRKVFCKRSKVFRPRLSASTRDLNVACRPIVIMSITIAGLEHQPKSFPQTNLYFQAFCGTMPEVHTEQCISQFHLHDMAILQHYTCSLYFQAFCGTMPEVHKEQCISQFHLHDMAILQHYTCSLYFQAFCGTMPEVHKEQCISQFHLHDMAILQHYTCS